MNNKLSKKSKSLRQAIERYNLYTGFVEQYTKSKALDMYIDHIKSSYNTLSKDTIEHYDKLIYLYKHGNYEPLLSNLYYRLLAADEYKRKVAEELKSLLRESCE